MIVVMQNDTPVIRLSAFRPAIRFVDRSTNATESEIVADSNSLRIRIGQEVDNDTALPEKLRITSDGDVLPAGDNTQDFGSSTKRWANVYTGDMHLNNMNTGGNEVDGSEGHWTMQEGADDLFLINRNTR